jgi:hypothetical protein
MNCPVPDEQRPINQYLELKESWFFRWGMLERGNFWQTNLKVWLGFWLIAAPIASVSFSPTLQPAKFLFWASFGATLCFILPLLRLYLGWNYISDRLSCATVLYEETGWYDGQTWCKPAADLLRERLLVDYEIQPRLHRLKIVFALTIVLLVADICLWQIVK